MSIRKCAQITGRMLILLMMLFAYACKEEQYVRVAPYETTITGLDDIVIPENPLKVILNRNDIRTKVQLIKSGNISSVDSLYLILVDQNNVIIPEIKPMALANRDLSKLNSQRNGAIEIEFKGRLLTATPSRRGDMEKFNILQSARKFILSTGLRASNISPSATQQVAEPPAFQVGNIPELVKYAKPAVFLVYSYTLGQRSGSQGTGFFISSDGIGVSNNHVFEGGNRQYVKTADNQQFDVTEILARSAEYDYVIFRVEPSDTPFRYLKITDTPPLEGEEIVVLGNPHGLEGTVTKGIVSALRDPLIQFDAAISHGSSGSPVLNLKGEVLGIATLKLDGCENCNMAFDINTVLSDIRLRN